MAEELAAPPAPAGDAPLPSMQMYATWREKRVQRFSSGVERMRSRLKELQDEREEAVPAPGASQPFSATQLTVGGSEAPTSLSAACRTIVYSLVEVAALQGELNSANRTSEEINRMAQTQLVEAAQAMRKMKQHVEQLARTKRHYEATIKDMSEKLTTAEKANLELRSRKPEVAPSDRAVGDELATTRKEVDELKEKLAKTEENCQRVLARVGVGHEAAPRGRGAGSARERPGTAPARVRFPPIDSAEGGAVRSSGGAAADGGGKAAGSGAAKLAAASHLQDASPPTTKEIRDYAEFLGLNPDEDEEFLWIAEEALCAPLPAGWTEHMRQEYGAVYYFNAHTQESSWSKRPPPWPCACLSQS